MGIFKDIEDQRNLGQEVPLYRVDMPIPNYRLTNYIIEEVQRQGHDTNQLDGIKRIRMMTHAWEIALERSISSPMPSLEDVGIIATYVEPRNGRGYRRWNFSYPPEAPDWPEVPRLMENLWGAMGSLTPEEFYKNYEEVHPWEDGNGRSGKIIYNWMKKTLFAPVLPPLFFPGSIP